MPHLKTTALPFVLLMSAVLVSCTQQPAPSAEQANATTQAATAADSSASSNAAQTPEQSAAHEHEGVAHQDHDSKHGGTFFMALDNKHHLEGALERPGVFRVYMYDAYTHAVSPEVLGQASAKVIWGDQDGAPEIELKPNADGSALEAQAPQPIHFPVTLTLLCRFPGAEPSSRPELLTFPFSHFSHIDTTPHTHPPGG
jgi:hypothetical protein